MVSQTSPRKFQFLRAIASGGFGDVYLCKEFHSTGFSRDIGVYNQHFFVSSYIVVYAVRNYLSLLCITGGY